MKLGQPNDAIDREDVAESDEYEQKEREGEERQARVSRLVLDVLKPREITVIQLGEELAKANGVSRVSITSREVDSETETLRISLDGTEIEYEQIVNEIETLGATVRSVDEVILER